MKPPYAIGSVPSLGATCTPHLRRVPEGNPLCITQAPILCLHFRLALPVQSTPTPYRSLSSICGMAVSADVTHDEYERHRACSSVKTSTNQPCHVPLHARTLRGAALSSSEAPFSSLVRARRGQESQWPDGGSQLVYTLPRIYFF